MAENSSNNSSPGEDALTDDDIQRAITFLNIQTDETHSFDDKLSLLQKYIMQSDDICEIYNVMDELNISTDGAKTIEETKERIKIRLTTTRSELTSEINSLINIKQEFDSSKDILDSLYEEYNDILQNTFSVMNEHLRNEDIISKVARDSQETQETLQNTKCTIIVTGETGAGKSTLLNLILNDMVLPHHAISCTSTICMIKYGEKKHMKISYCSGKVNEIDVNDDEESKAKIKDAMFKRSGREKGSDIRSVELQLPSDILKCGLVLVDSPGIGENEAMENILTKFIKENQIQGFIYVIKVDGAACGIQEDRILKLMKIVIEKHQSSNTDPSETCLYDTATTLFIFNRWDLVREEERETVHEHVVKRLLRCSQGLDTSEILFMSATSAKRQLENGFVPRSYVDLMKGIKTMMEKTTFIILKRFYRWLNYMVSRSLHHCKTLFSGADFSEYQQKQRFQEAEKKLNILEKNSVEIFQELRDSIDAEETRLKQCLTEQLQSPDIQNKIYSFENTEIDFLLGSENVDEAIYNMANRKIIDTISEYTDIDQEINNHKEKLIKIIKKKTFLLQEELSIIESEMNSKIINPMDTYHGLRRISNLSVCSWQLPILPPKIPSSLFARVALKAKRILKKKNSRQLAAEKKSIKKICDEEIQLYLRENSYVSCQLDSIRDYLDLVEESIPKLIESNKTLMKKSAENRSRHQKEKETYIKALNKILLLQDKIARFGYTNAFNQKKQIENSIKSEMSSSTLYENSAIDSGIVVDTKSRVPQSLFVEMTPAFSCDVEITIRKYFNTVDVPSLYTEIEKLTYLHHESVAKFIETISTENSTPSILFDERLFSLRCRTNNIRYRPLVSKDMYPIFIENIISGLVYIHSKGLTHPEISLDSVMINWHQQVKLIGMALPRKVNILDMDQPIHDNMYLAPEVLNGGVYEPPADVFGFGLLICELYIKKKVFLDKSHLSVLQFCETVDTSEVEYFELIPDTYKNLVLNMLKKQQSERFTSNHIWKCLSN